MIHQALLAGLVAIAAAALVGCRSVAQQAEASSDRVNAWTVPGVLRIASDTQPENLDPLLASDSIDTDLSMFWAGYLLNWSDKGEFVPELATEAPTLQNGGISRDGRSITYHLRPSVLWQDGSPFTADDVVFTWRQVMNPRNIVQSRAGYELIDQIDEPDDHTVVVHLRRPYAPFVATFFSMSNSAYCVLPKHLLGKYASLNRLPFNRMPIGTGPYRVVANDGSVIKMVANPKYWRGAPGLREVEYRAEKNQQLLLADLTQHKIDFMYAAGKSLEPKLRGIAGTTIYLYPFNGFADVGFNLTSPVLADKRVRQALAYGIDRRDLIDVVASGLNSPADSDQPAFSWAHSDRVRQYAFDPARASRLLDSAGWIRGSDGVRVKNGRRMHLILVASTDAAALPDASERLIQRNWRDLGVDIELRNYSPAKLYGSMADGGVEATGKFDVAIESWVNGVDPDDSGLFQCRMVPPRGFNVYHYCSHALDSAEDAALTSYDLTRRKAAYDRIQQILADDVPLTVLWFEQEQDVVNVDLKNYRPASTSTPFWNTWQYQI